MSVPAPSSSQLWSRPGGPHSGDRPRDQSERPEPAPVDAAELVSDAALLRAFVETAPGTVAAAAVLARIVERHGSLVYRVAQRMMVSDSSLADDVFQATFLVLAQSARKIQRSASLASWLHGTARNIGRRALAQKYAARSGTDSGVEMVTAVDDDPFSEMIRSHERQLLDEELRKLPEPHRAPLVLHYLEERSHQEISQLLGITVAAVESRMKRAKQELRARLVRRGITLSIAVAAFSTATSVATAAPPAALVISTISLAATGQAVGTSLTAATASTALQLAGKELAAMSAASKATALFVGAVGTLTVGGAVLFGAALGGYSGAGTRIGTGPGTSEPLAVLGVDSGLGQVEEEPRTLLLAQADNASNPADQPDPPAEKPDDAEPVSPDEDAQTSEVEEQPEPAEPQNSEPSPEEGTDQLPEENEQSSERKGPIVASFRQLSAGDRKVYDALDRETALEFPDNTLREVFDFIQEMHSVHVRFNRKALEDVGLDQEARVSLVIDKVPLSTSLSLLLDNVNGTKLDYYVDRGILFITTDESMHDSYHLRFYDLSGGVENFAQAVEKYARIIGEDASGHEPTITSFGDCVAIESSYGVHRKIEEFITGIMEVTAAREAAGQEPPVVPPLPRESEDTPEDDDHQPSSEEQADPAHESADEGTPEPAAEMEDDDDHAAREPEDHATQPRPSVAASPHGNAADQRINAALDQIITLDFPDNTLDEVFSYITELHHIPIQPDHQALKDAGVKGDERISIQLTGITLRSALKLLLENVDGKELDYYIDNGILCISTPVAMREKISLRFYDLSQGQEIENLSHAVTQYANTLGDSPVSVSELGDHLAIRASVKTHADILEFIQGALKLAEHREAAGQEPPVVPPHSPEPSQPQAPPHEAPAAGGVFKGT